MSEQTAERGRVLAIDDEQAFLEMYQDLLSAEGYQVETAQSYAGALQQLDRGGWSVVLVDLQLRGCGGPDLGLELIAEARHRAPDAEVILVSALASVTAIERALSAGACDYLEKDLNFESTLRAKVRKAMHRRAVIAASEPKDDAR